MEYRYNCDIFTYRGHFSFSWIGRRLLEPEEAPQCSLSFQLAKRPPTISADTSYFLATNNQCRYFFFLAINNQHRNFFFFGTNNQCRYFSFFGHKQSALVLLISWPPTTSIDTSYFLALNNQRRYFFFLPTNNHHRYFSFFGHKQSAQVLLIFWPVTQLQILHTTNVDTKDALDKCCSALRFMKYFYIDLVYFDKADSVDVIFFEWNVELWGFLQQLPSALVERNAF